MKLSPIPYLINHARSLKRFLLIPSTTAARKDSQKRSYHPVWLGTQVMPYSIVVNARKNSRDIYDD